MDQIERNVTTESLDGSVQETARVTRSVPDVLEQGELRAAKKNQIVWYVAGVINALLLLRMLFLLLGASRVGFTSFLYGITDPLVAPFRGIFPAPAVDGAYFDSAALAAIVIYSLIAWGISALIDLLGRPAPAAR